MVFGFCNSFSAGEAVCVECSLRDDCLRCFAFCKHSKSPIFNRSMRTFNRLPIYLGEELIDTINREAVLKDIRLFDKRKLKSAREKYCFTPDYRYKCGRYNEYDFVEHIYQYIADTTYPTAYKWLQRFNGLEENDVYDEDERIFPSSHIRSYYKDTKKAKKLFRGWFKSIAHKRIIARFNLNMNMLYQDEDKRGRLGIPIWNECKYWMKQSIDNYSPHRQKHSVLREIIRKRDGWYSEASPVQKCGKYNVEYLYEADRTRINQLRRYRQLFIDADNQIEKFWFLMKMGMLCYDDRDTTSLMQSKKYHFLGSFNSHLEYVNDGRFPNHHLIGYNDPEDDWDDNHHWKRDRKQYYDLRQKIYKLTNYDECFDDIDVYDSWDTHQFSQLITTDIELPKINHVRHYYKDNVMTELKYKLYMKS